MSSSATFKAARVFPGGPPPFLPATIGQEWEPRGDWPCSWIAIPNEPAAPWVAIFRRQFSIDQPLRTLIHVTADERYELFVNGVRIARGPERGDRANWFYETFDLSLPAGQHEIAARVVAQSHKSWAQVTVRHGFLLCPENPAAIALFGTGKSAWRVRQINGYTFTDASTQTGTAMGAGPGFVIDAAAMKSESNWSDAIALRPGNNGFWLNATADVQWLKPATLPAMLDRPIARQPVVRLATDLDRAKRFITGQPLELSPGESFSMLLDLEDYYCLYPQLHTRGGSGAAIELSFAEALYEIDPATKRRRKTDRSRVDGLTFVGFGDTFLPAGDDHLFEPLWWRCGRYIRLNASAGTEPLTIESLKLIETRYPIDPSPASELFESDDAALNRVVPTCVRTLQMCMHETYMDCPYYEQLMYVGDTRLQVLLTHVLTSDARLPEKAVRIFDSSRANPTGLTTSNYPAKSGQIIPPFALGWVAMIHDFAMYRPIRATVESMLPGARAVLDCFLATPRTDGLIQTLPGWNYVDVAWEGGVPPGGHVGEICPIVNWQIVLALNAMAELERFAGEAELAARFDRHASALAEALIRSTWDESRGLVADDVARTQFSEHAQSLAILSGRLKSDLARRVALALANPNVELNRTNLYFTHYLFEAARAAFVSGLLTPDEAAGILFRRFPQWTAMADRGHVTFPETAGDATRSDCHAWSSHPLYHLLATVLGVRPAGMGAPNILIQPLLGPLQSARGMIAHPAGNIEVSLRRVSTDRIAATILLPDGVSGEFVWARDRIALSPGSQEFEV